MFATIPVFYVIESMLRSDHGTPCFEGMRCRCRHREQRFDVLHDSTHAFRRFGRADVDTVPRAHDLHDVWVVVLSTKMIFGHYLLISPLRSRPCDQGGDLCWNKESDEYTSCINLEGDALVEALKFKPKVTYFTEVKNSEDDYDESDIQLSYYEPDSGQRRVFSFPGGGGDFTGASWGDESQFATDIDLNESVDPYNGQYRGWSSGASRMSSAPRAELESALSGVSRARERHSWRYWPQKAQSSGARVHRRRDRGSASRSVLRRPRVAIFNVRHGHRSGCYGGRHAYFCDTFLWYTLYASLFTIFLQWRGKISHAQRWAKFLRNFQQIPNLFCEKLTNKTWPKMVMVLTTTPDGYSSDGRRRRVARVAVETAIGRRLRGRRRREREPSRRRCAHRDRR